MSKILIAVCVLLLIAAALSLPTRSRAQAEAPQEITISKPQRLGFVPGDVIVRYRTESTAKNKIGSSRITAKDGRLLDLRVEDFEGSKLVPGLRMARLGAGVDTMAAIAALRAQPDVLYAEPNYILRADVTTPNDPHFTPDQPSMTKIGATQVWDTQRGSNSIVVGVIDQGIDTEHLDLQANIWTNPMPGSIPGISGDLHGFNFVDNNGNLFSGEDSENHATHVAGTIGAVGNNGRGVAGVNWSVRLMSLKFIAANGFGVSEDAIRACAYAKEMRQLWISSGQTQGANIRVLNGSFGGDNPSQSFIDALQGLNSAGILFVSSAGNDDQDGTREPDNDIVPHYPSSFDVPNMIAVASTDHDDNLADFSHFGATSVDLAAPGVDILSTTPPCADPGENKPCNPEFVDPNGDSYSFFDGTSMSAPHVAGAAALLWAQNPNLSVAQVKNLLLVNGDVLPVLIDKTLTGRRLNVAKSFQALAENDTTAPGAITNFRIISQNGRTFNLGWTASGDDGASGQASLYQVNFTDGGSGAVTTLKGLLPMPSGMGQIATVTVPFRHTSGTISIQEFDNAGNTGPVVSLPIGIPLAVADPYTTSVGSTVGLTTGGADLEANFDDRYIDVVFPAGFTFPFFGTPVDPITISTNGVIYLGNTPPERPSGNADDLPSFGAKLGGYHAIAGLWDDLDLSKTCRGDAGVFQVTNPGQIIFRWQGISFNGTTCVGARPVNFEIELNSSGVIKTRYGSGNASMLPTVGISGGGQDPYIIASHTKEIPPRIDLPNAPEVTFTPRAPSVSTIQLIQSSFSANENAASISVGVSRTGDTTSVATVNFASSDSAGLASCNTIGSSASSRCDYLTTVGKLKFAAGETSKTITIPLIDDVLAENAESFSIALSSPTGATLGSTTSATLTINDGGAEGGPNPIDTASFFVRQHYVDFLNREPDSSGLAFWTNEITSCGTNTQCIEVKRVNVSAAFFLSIEFQETGYLVYRVNKSAFGNLPGAPVPISFTDFLRDTQQIGLGVQVNVGDWQNILEANKQDFTLAYVQQPAFLAAFPNSMTAEAIVDKLNLNAGGVLSVSERANLVSLLGVTPSDLSRRAAVLRAVSEDQDLKSLEFNKAFVLMQYFGYLRRSPNDFPDSDFSGFNFWLGKLNQFNGNFIDAEMVKAFITSIEYRRRFAP